MGSIADAVAYPDQASDFPPHEIDAALIMAGMPAKRLRELGGGAPEGLSGGERQRVALARLFLHRPDWAFLDEATSALDQESEKELLARLRRTLPGSTLVIVSHRKPEGAGRVRTIDLTRQRASLADSRRMETA